MAQNRLTISSDVRFSKLQETVADIRKRRTKLYQAHIHDKVRTDVFEEPKDVSSRSCSHRAFRTTPKWLSNKRNLLILSLLAGNSEDKAIW